MRHLLLLGWLAQTVLVAAPPHHLQGTADPYYWARKVSATATIASATYCQGDDIADDLSIKLDITLSNANPVPIAVYTGAIEAPLIRIGRTDEQLQAGTYETESFALVMRDNAAPLVDERWFQIIPPSGSLNLSLNQVPLTVWIGTGPERPARVLLPGSHVMRVTLQTWPLEEDGPETNTWRTKLAPKGVLLTVPVVTRSLPLHIDDESRAIKCNQGKVG